MSSSLIGSGLRARHAAQFMGSAARHRDEVGIIRGRLAALRLKLIHALLRCRGSCVERLQTEPVAWACVHTCVRAGRNALTNCQRRTLFPLLFFFLSLLAFYFPNGKQEAQLHNTGCLCVCEREGCSQRLKTQKDTH